MHGPISVKSPNNISEWKMGFNSAFKGLIEVVSYFRTLISSSYCSENFTSRIFDLYTWPETVVSTERVLES
jgi:hypothetical protein